MWWLGIALGQKSFCILYFHKLNIITAVSLWLLSIFPKLKFFFKVRPLSPFADAPYFPPPSTLHLITCLLEFASTLRSPLFSGRTAPITLNPTSTRMLSSVITRSFKRCWQGIMMLAFCLILAFSQFTYHSHPPSSPLVDWAPVQEKRNCMKKLWLGGIGTRL